jgi:hypothetical protein
MNVLRVPAIVSLLCLAACASATESESSESGEQAIRRLPSINASTHSCSSTLAFVSSHGAALVYTSATTYDRVVTGTEYCAGGEITTHSYVSTTDEEHCFIGYTCTMFSGGGGGGDGAGGGGGGGGGGSGGV